MARVALHACHLCSSLRGKLFLLQVLQSNTNKLGSCIFPTIFTLSIRGLGRHTKRGSSFIVAAVSGGALFPALTGLAADSMTYHKAMCVPLAGFFVSFVFPIYLNTVCKKELDGFRATQIGYKDERRGTIIGDVNDIATFEAMQKRQSVTVEKV
jgi:hypothetical protein